MTGVTTIFSHTMNKSKLFIGTNLGVFFFSMSRAFADSTMGVVPGPEQTGSVLTAFWMQAIYNPASFTAIGLLGVVAWLCDDLPWINSRYVKHITVIVGMCIYWAFADPATVSKIYPHPLAIYLSYGAVCGAIAYLGHWQIISRVRDFFATKQQQASTQTP